MPNELDEVRSAANLLSTIAKSIRDAYFYMEEVRRDILKGLAANGNRKTLLRTKQILHIRNPDFRRVIIRVRNRDDWAALRSMSAEMLGEVEKILAALKKETSDLLTHEAYDKLLLALVERRAFLLTVLDTDLPPLAARQALIDEYQNMVLMLGDAEQALLGYMADSRQRKPRNQL